MSIPCKLIYRFSTTSTEISVFFVEARRVILKKNISWKFKGKKRATAIFKSGTDLNNLYPHLSKSSRNLNCWKQCDIDAKADKEANGRERKV